MLNLNSASYWNTFALLVCIFFFSTSIDDLAQVEYPPETHAIPIPKIDDLPLADGPFKPTVDSLKQFQCPNWFRDGKFGIWAHWGPQAAGDDGDWYARHIYEEGSGPYEDHLKQYGHPSKAGYKDIIPLWKAEKWDPDQLMALYKAAGAHYFVAQAVHHDNFDNWDSKYQKWNSVNMGPHKDIVALWQAAAKKQGLPFGFSEHLGHSFDFMQAAHGADKLGPMAGVPYDGNDPAYFDLYQLPAAPGTGGWYTNDKRFAPEWYARIHDVVTHYKPDFLYSDGGVPYGEAGLRIIAQLYNLSVQDHDGKLEAVYCCKKNYAGTDYFDGICVQDVERGGMNDIQPFVWQTDTSTGDWYYNKNDHYKTFEDVIHTLMDIVSKNGNLLLNVVLYPDGSLPPEMQTFLGGMADWMKVNGDAVFDTRPWTVYGEGSARMKGGAFNEGTVFTSRDIRFTRKGNDIYFTVLGIPTASVTVRSLASDSPLVTGDPTKVTLLGATDDVKWSRTADGLTVQIPDTLPCKSALCFKVSGLTTVDHLSSDVLSAFRNKLSAPTIPKAGADGVIQLNADDAYLQGSTIKLEGNDSNMNIGWWQKPDEGVSWKFKIGKPGSYQVSIDMASEADSQFILEQGTQKLSVTAPATGGFNSYKTTEVGTVHIDTPGIVTLKINPESPDTWKSINLKSVRLRPE